MPSASRRQQCAGITSRSARQPSAWPGQPRNFKLRQVCGRPARHWSQVPQGIAGSTATRSPGRRCRTAGPACSTTRALVAQGEGIAHYLAADAAGVVVMHIGPAYAHGGNTQQNILRPSQLRLRRVANFQPAQSRQSHRLHKTPRLNPNRSPAIPRRPPHSARSIQSPIRF